MVQPVEEAGEEVGWKSGFFLRTAGLGVLQNRKRRVVSGLSLHFADLRLLTAIAAVLLEADPGCALSSRKEAKERKNTDQRK